jgi:serine/threonine protein kinase
MGGTTQRSRHPVREPAAVDQLRAGDVFACQWRLDRPIGTGGMSRVFSATHISGRRDALKILHAHMLFDPAARVRFLREAEVTARVRHAGAIHVRDHGVGPEGRPFVAMELLRGATLDALWKRANRGLPMRAVLRVIDRVLDVLAACHRLGIVHCDMKPSNVFVTDAGAVRVLDFGIARLPGADDLARAGTALGTPGFMSPEQAAGAWDQVDAASDVFSVGAILFALISGKKLHAGGDGQQAFTTAATRPAPSLSSVCDAPPAVVELVDRALLWDKRRRFADASEMRIAVRRVLEALGGDADAALPMTPARRWALHARTADGSEPTEVAALTQAFSWMEDGLQADADRGRAMALDAAQQWLVEARSTTDKAVDVAIFPFGFRAAEHDVWDPAPPLDQVPRRLHEAGVRALRLDPRHDGRA